jgi:methylenetetrahydrofolate dehydrogenase (NADP+)/methenyltetrahydrofolate cyclohydrolase
MTSSIIDGKAISAARRAALTEQVAELTACGNTPGLAVVVVGEDPASAVYVRNKEQGCADTGIRSEKYALPVDITHGELLSLIAELNSRDDIHGILVQLPLPSHINEDDVLEAIDPRKDVDGFHPTNVGRMVVGKEAFSPCTPHGCMVLLDELGCDLTGKEAVVVGRSNIVGKPVALMLLERNATVTVCHSRTVNLPEVIGRADVVIVAVGRPEMVKGSWLKPGAVVVDVGINRVDGRLVGDVEYESASQVASAVTPVPGGVGPMTIAMLLENTVTAAMRASSAI